MTAALRRECEWQAVGRAHFRYSILRYSLSGEFFGSEKALRTMLQKIVDRNALSLCGRASRRAWQIKPRAAANE